jgi:hypothetical protein
LREHVEQFMPAAVFDRSIVDFLEGSGIATLQMHVEHPKPRPLLCACTVLQNNVLNYFSNLGLIRCCPKSSTAESYILSRSTRGKLYHTILVTTQFRTEPSHTFNGLKAVVPYSSVHTLLPYVNINNIAICASLTIVTVK